MKLRTQIAGFLGACLLTSASLQAQVLVSSSDIINDNAYSFTINASTFGSGGDWTGISNNAIIAATNVQYMKEAGGTQYIYGNPGATAAHFTLKWDFSNSGYRPVSVDLSNIVVMLAAQATGATYSLETSLNGIDFTSYLDLVADGNNHQIYNPQNHTVAIDSITDVFYQRISFTAPGPDGMKDVNSQWGRVDDSLMGTQVYAADFSVVAVPEAGSIISLLAGAALVAGVARKRLRKES